MGNGNGGGAFVGDDQGALLTPHGERELCFLKPANQVFTLS